MNHHKLIGQLSVLAVGTENITLKHYLLRAVHVLKDGCISEQDKQEITGALEMMRDLYSWNQAEVLDQAVDELLQLDEYYNNLAITPIGWGKVVEL